MAKETLVKVDKRGRAVLPLKVRRELKIRNIVKIRVEEGKVILTPVEDPLETLGKIVVKGTKDVEKEIRRLRRRAEKELLKEVGKTDTN
ncbi:MAG: AbrB/MazE/SpoVT family DNA-binding domain-containing protein [archaeon]|nr:AbrB/MazE/SpoVT family DNA-binding domain-containing protein [archaeon]MCP8314535.1 AbrB/MazE/SpoVT family DNA-binding domain-containing protein [archaeon]MCP8315714.1 AbrB/MazE/SpoVT family DNA-binding domain-containing protein [archaeon]